jgi:hypothetical protein
MNRITHVRRSWNAAALMLALALLPLGGCSSSTYGAEPGGAERGSSDLITSDEIRQQPNGDAYTIIRQVRPGWLRTRPTSSFGPGANNDPYVFVDDSRFGPLDSLYQIQSANIERMELISATDATTRYGTGFPGGIIRVVIRR